ncbi:MAG: gluconate 2-dehydrogenase subunit 3 family protein [Pseudomonadota bacterium]|nr:gluconate 2-dehydrogenase subunit 3 family protein [Pseudomonadota bacterium]
MAERFPGYDVLDKKDTPSWNAVTRLVIERRLATPRQPRFFTTEEWRTLEALCGRILPQPPGRPPVPIAALIDAKLLAGDTQGYSIGALPHDREAWRIGLSALDAEARQAHDAAFHDLSPERQDALLAQAQRGELTGAAWRGMPPDLFFGKRILADISAAYYAHPTAWNEIGFGGPASPRGYVRMALDHRDPWEAAEAAPGHDAQATRKNRRVGR